MLFLHALLQLTRFRVDGSPGASAGADSGNRTGIGSGISSGAGSSACTSTDIVTRSAKVCFIPFFF
jgi:hypothetical protein